MGVNICALAAPSQTNVGTHQMHDHASKPIIDDCCGIQNGYFSQPDQPCLLIGCQCISLQIEANGITAEHVKPSHLPSKSKAIGLAEH
jgi:hypothetical protein